jgi:hypothetical protein
MRLRNSKGQFISAQAEEAIRDIARDQGAKEVQQFYSQNENEFKGLFSATNEAKFSTENAGGYISQNFDKFKINDGEKTHTVSRGEALKLVAQFQNFINKEGANTAIFTGEMKDKDKNGSFHTLEINLPVNKNKTGKGFKMSKDKLEKMEESGDIEYYKKSKKKSKKTSKKK